MQKQLFTEFASDSICYSLLCERICFVFVVFIFTEVRSMANGREDIGKTSDTRPQPEDCRTVNKIIVRCSLDYTNALDRLDYLL